jgi:Glycosyl transferase family 11
MICVRLKGGLIGNQMFSYACARHLARKHRTDVLIDATTYLPDRKGRRYALDAFNIPEKFGKLDGPVCVEQSLRFDPTILRLSENVTLDGYFQCEKYFWDITSTILHDFSLRRPRTNDALAWAAQIANTPNSVAIHFRRTDAADGSPEALYHGTPGFDYYDGARKHMRLHLGNPRFFAFSDDIEWVKLFSNLDSTCIIEGCTDAEDLWLMSLCKHAVIANSSFSWWGAWLGSHQRNGIVIAPQQWLLKAKRPAYDRDLREAAIHPIELAEKIIGIVGWIAQMRQEKKFSDLEPCGDTSTICPEKWIRL